jgi:hypothetical protein
MEVKSLIKDLLGETLTKVKAVLANVVKRTASKLYSKDFSMGKNRYSSELRKRWWSR